MENVIIRDARIEDAKFLCEIYKPYVEQTAISFELTAPDKNEFENRIKNISKDYPFIVLCENSVPVGYAYASSFHPRDAYKKSVELSIYIDKIHHHKGYGKLLYTELEKKLKERGFAVMYACIAATSRNPDANLTDASILFHEKCGFEHVAYFKNCACKFGKWYNMVYMQKFIISDFCDFDSPANVEVGDVYDEQKHITGKTFVRESLFSKNLGLCVHVCVFNDKKELLIQQRSIQKKSAPGKWDFSASGMVDAGESSQKGAARELEEELGIKVQIDFPPIITKIFFNTYNDYYFVKKSVDLNEILLQKTEVQSVKWASRAEVMELRKADEFLSYPESLISLIFDVIEEKD